MEIDIIFDERLYSFKHQKRKNEYRRLLDEWNNPEYIFKFFEKNKKFFQDPFFGAGYDVKKFSEDIESDLESIECFLGSVNNNKDVDISHYFEPLSDKKKDVKILSLHKKKLKLLRLYAIKIAEDMFVITGGAIKITKKMQDHPMTKEELAKLEQAQSILKHKGIDDCETFFKFVKNQQ